MNSQAIKILLEKYFEGATSLQEEAALRQYFTEEVHIPKELLYAKAMFTFIKKEKNVRFKKSKNKPFYLIGIAASIILATFLIINNLQQTLSIDQEQIVYAYVNGEAITDKDVAIEYTKQALLAVSQNLDKGTKHLNQLNQLNKVEILIKK